MSVQRLDLNLVHEIPVQVSSMTRHLCRAVFLLPLILVFVKWGFVVKETVSLNHDYERRLAEYRKVSSTVPCEDNDETENLFARVDEANRILSGQVQSWTEMLYRLEQSVPDGISLNEIACTLNGEGEITGSTISMNAMLELVDRLKKDSEFSDAFINSHTSSGDNENGTIRFKLSFMRAKPPDSPASGSEVDHE